MPTDKDSFSETLILFISQKEPRREEIKLDQIRAEILDVRIALLILEVVLEGWLREGLISPGSGPGDPPPIGVFRPTRIGPRLD